MSSIQLKKISNVTVLPVKKKEITPEQILGYFIIPVLYCIMFLCAFKNSGKTTLINTILKGCIDKDTHVIVFSGTHELDKTWLHIKDWLAKKEIQTTFYSSIYEDNTDQIPIVMEYMKTQTAAMLAAEAEAKKKPVNDMIQIIKYDHDSAKIKIRKPSKIAPKFFVVFDDVSNELKNRDVSYLLKTMRHYRAKVIVSSQYLNDLDIGGRSQVDFWILFHGQSEKKLLEVFDQTGLRISEESFQQIYSQVTSKQYQFLMIDKNTGDMYQNFNNKIILPDSI